jgi:hypothetical protein
MHGPGLEMGVDQDHLAALARVVRNSVVERSHALVRRFLGIGLQQFILVDPALLLGIELLIDFNNIERLCGNLIGVIVDLYLRVVNRPHHIFQILVHFLHYFIGFG